MNGLNPFDQAVMGFVQTHCHNQLADAVFPVITYLGEGGVLWIILALALLIFGRESGRKTGVLMLFAMLAGLLIGELALKNIVCRPRPFVEFPDYAKALIPPALIPPPSGYSFPSGHSCSSFAAGTVIFIRSRHTCRRFGLLALILAGLIAFSRVFLFVHYPTDVLCGAALGVICALCSAAALKLWQRRRERTLGPH